MYCITELATGKWFCELMIQDGWERWGENTREEAIRSMIKGARALNHGYIREDDITFAKQSKKSVQTSDGIVLSNEDEQMLKDIVNGKLKVLPYDHYFFKYRLTEKEAEMVVAIREGDASVRYETK